MRYGTEMWFWRVRGRSGCRAGHAGNGPGAIRRGSRAQRRIMVHGLCLGTTRKMLLGPRRRAYLTYLPLLNPMSRNLSMLDGLVVYDRISVILRGRHCPCL